MKNILADPYSQLSVLVYSHEYHFLIKLFFLCKIATQLTICKKNWKLPFKMVKTSLLGNGEG
jgi:hypothetical protein